MGASLPLTREDSSSPSTLIDLTARIPKFGSDHCFNQRIKVKHSSSVSAHKSQSNNKSGFRTIVIRWNRAPIGHELLHWREPRIFSWDSNATAESPCSLSICCTPTVRLMPEFLGSKPASNYCCVDRECLK